MKMKRILVLSRSEPGFQPYSKERWKVKWYGKMKTPHPPPISTIFVQRFAIGEMKFTDLPL